VQEPGGGKALSAFPIQNSKRVHQRVSVFVVSNGGGTRSITKPSSSSRPLSRTGEPSQVAPVRSPQRERNAPRLLFQGRRAATKAPRRCSLEEDFWTRPPERRERGKTHLPSTRPWHSEPPRGSGAATAKLTNGAATSSTPPPAADRALRRYRPFLRNKRLEVAPCRPVSPRREEKEREQKGSPTSCLSAPSVASDRKIVDSEADSAL
jgi:hypothetical protein